MWIYKIKVGTTKLHFILTINGKIIINNKYLKIYLLDTVKYISYNNM